MVKDIVFNYQSNQGTKEIEFTNLYVCRIKLIATYILLDKYKHKVQGNWKLKLALDGGWLDDNKDDNSTIDAIEEAGPFSTIEIDKDNDDNK